LVILCADVETQNLNVNMAADTIAVYYGMSVCRS